MNSVEDNAAKQYELPKWEFNRNADPKEIDLQNKIIVLSRAGTDFQLTCSIRRLNFILKPKLSFLRENHENDNQDEFLDFRKFTLYMIFHENHI